MLEANLQISICCHLALNSHEWNYARLILDSDIR